MAQLIACGPPQNLSEKKAFAYLQTHLPEDWILLTNLVVPNRCWSPEIDCVIIGDGYVWAVDVKGFRGAITGDEFQWRFDSGTSRKAPLANLIQAAKVLAGKVNDNSAGQNVFVAEMIILTESSCKLAVADPRIQDTVFPLEGVERRFQNARYRRPRVPLTRAGRLAIAERLAGKKALEDAFGGAAAPLMETIAPVLAFTLTNERGFRRIYYSSEVRSFLLGKNQLRGISPTVWNQWTDHGVDVSFVHGTVGLAAATGEECIVLNGRKLSAGKKVLLRNAEGVLAISGIEMRYAIARMESDAAEA